MPTYPRSEIDAILAQGRRDITALSQPAVDAFVSAFSRNLNLLIQRYTELEEQARAGSKSADQLRRDLLPIKRQAEADFAYWQTVAGDALDDTVRASWASGVGMATRIVEAKQVAGAITPMFGTFNRLAYEAQYISTQAGPVRRLLSSIASDTTEKAVDVLRNAMMEGINPRKTAKRLMQAVSADLTRCETIARTESARAHKEGTLARYTEMEISYVRWMSAEQMRTCPACWAMDGRVYKTTNVPNDHPNGRCTMEALLDDEIAEYQQQYGDNWENDLWNVNITKNTGIMQRMDDDQLLHIFGSQRQIDAFRAGAPLQDAVKMVNNRTWGVSPSVQALKHPGANPPPPTVTPKPKPPTVRPPIAPPAPVAPPKPVVDWKHNLPDEWTPCDVKTAQQRISDMLSINDDVWGTVDSPRDTVAAWNDGGKTERRLRDNGRAFVNNEASNLSKHEINMRSEQLMQFCKMCDELQIPRPAYFNLGEIGRRGVDGDCGAGINIYKEAFDEVRIRHTRVRHTPETGGVRYLHPDGSLARHPIMTKDGVDVEVRSVSKEDVDHEFGHFLGNMHVNNGVEFKDLRPIDMLMNEKDVLFGFTDMEISKYGMTSLMEDLAENWQAFVNYGRDGVGKKVAARFDDLGWTKAAQKAGVIKWK